MRMPTTEARKPKNSGSEGKSSPVMIDERPIRQRVDMSNFQLVEWIWGLEPDCQLRITDTWTAFMAVEMDGVTWGDRMMENRKAL
jgi:hypothetical protein